MLLVEELELAVLPERDCSASSPPPPSFVPGSTVWMSPASFAKQTFPTWLMLWELLGRQLPPPPFFSKIYCRLGFKKTGLHTCIFSYIRITFVLL